MSRIFREQIARSLDSIVLLESFLSDLNVKVDRKDDVRPMEGTRLKSNSHVIKASYVPPCKFVKEPEVAQIPVPEKEEDLSRMMSADEAREYIAKVKKENIVKVANAILATVNNEMRLDLGKHPNQVVFNYEVPAAGLVESAMVTELCKHLEIVLTNLDYKSVSISYGAKVIPTILIKFSL